MSSKTKIRDVLKTAKEIGLDISIVDKTKKYYRAGQRGHLHLDKFCYKLSSYDVNDTTSTALSTKGKICNYCYESSLSQEDQKIFKDAKVLTKISNNLDTLEEMVEDPINASQALRHIKVLTDHLKNVTSEEYNFDVIKKINERIESLTTKASKNKSGSEDKIIKHISASNFENSINLDRTRELNILLEKHSYDADLRRLFESWISSIKEGADYAKARENVLSKLSKVTLKSISQITTDMDSFLSYVKENDGISIKEALSNLWKNETLNFVNLEMDIWEKELDIEKNNLKKVLVSIDPGISHNDKMVTAILGYYGTKTNSYGGSILTLPLNVANYVKRVINDISSYRSNARIHKILEIDNSDIHETALALWVPDRYSSNALAQFENALETARKV